ncbi:hypothetical protein C1645_762020 [Glomus cerebriforme]|uniref:MARVEL domain-containing protein n=1 Tax=Glomus cerebriforme TaxID=658196 RepID=A0A397T5N7_9GLOM|nr:hypothetical protein C1645_762020 [Glomus cerebriforme]
MEIIQGYSNFCFCIGLRTGVIISSILWMIEGIVLSIFLVIQVIGGEKVTTLSVLSIILSIYFIILSIISIFGLTSLIVYKSTPLLRMYSYTSWFFAVFINVVLSMVSNIALMVSKDTFINDCKEKGNDLDYCKNTINYKLFWLGIVLFFQVSLHFYFSIILRAYVKHCVHVERKQKKKQRKQRNFTKHLSDTSVYNIKVDKMFDAREQIEQIISIFMF